MAVFWRRRRLVFHFSRSWSAEDNGKSALLPSSILRVRNAGCWIVSRSFPSSKASIHKLAIEGTSDRYIWMYGIYIGMYVPVRPPHNKMPFAWFWWKPLGKWRFLAYFGTSQYKSYKRGGRVIIKWLCSRAHLSKHHDLYTVWLEISYRIQKVSTLS